jgi:hypothetical protein
MATAKISEKLSVKLVDPVSPATRSNRGCHTLSIVRFWMTTTPTKIMARNATSGRATFTCQNSWVGLRSSSLSEPCGHDLMQLPHRLHSRLVCIVRGVSKMGQAAARSEPLAHHISLHFSLQLAWFARRARDDAIE